MADKAKLLKIAQKYLSKGNVDKAITTFQQLVEVAPRDQRLLLRLAELQARVGRKKEAIQNYEKIASVYIQQDFTPKAIAVYKTILRLDSEFMTAYEKLAELYKNQGLEAEALSQLENLFSVYEDKKNESKQIEVLKIMVAMDHENLGFQVRLGEMLARKGLKQEAAEAFAKAAATLSRRGFHDRASQLFEKIISLNPDSIGVRRELCGHYLESGKFQEARKEIEAIIEFEPDDARMVLLLGRILFQLGRKSEAEDNIAKSITMFKEKGELEEVVREYLFVAQSHFRNEELDEAEVFYRHVMEAMPDETNAIKGLVSIAQARADRVGQIGHLLSLGRTLARKNDGSGARKAFGKVLELDPLNEEAGNFLADGEHLPEESPEELREEPEVFEVTEAELEEIRAEPEAAGKAGVPAEGGIGAEEGPGEGTGEPEEISAEDMEELEDQDLAGVELEETYQVPEGLEGEELPDIVLEDFGDEAGAGSEADQEGPPFDKGTVRKEAEREEEEASLDDLLAEAEVYKRYDLTDKLEETLRQISSFATDDPDILQKIEFLTRDLQGPESAGEEMRSPDASFGLPGTDVVTQPDIPVPEDVSSVDRDLEPGPPGKEQFQEDLEEAEFYLSQGLQDEAHRIYRSILRKSPGHPVATQALASPGQADRTDDALPEAGEDRTRHEAGKDQSDMPMVKGVRSKLIVEDSASEEVGGFLDLAEELRQELSEEFDHDIEPETPDEPVTFEEIFTQFKKGIEETLGEEEYETHYNLGIAYKEMGLFDDALREFEIGSRDPDLVQDSLSLMAMCFVEKNDYDSAVKAVRKAMEITSEGDRTGLYYQLGEIHERGKDWRGALAAYSEVQSRDPHFEGIDEVLQRVSVHADTAVPGEETDVPAEDGMDDLLSDLIKEVEEMASEKPGEPGGEPGDTKKDRISYI